MFFCKNRYLCKNINKNLTHRYHVDRGALLKLLSTLVTISTKTRENAVYTVQLAALRLASHNVQLMKKSLSPVEAMSHALNEFDINMDVFSKD
jgi:hypothetical protein